MIKAFVTINGKQVSGLYFSVSGFLQSISSWYIAAAAAITKAKYILASSFSRKLSYPAFLPKNKLAVTFERLHSCYYTTLVKELTNHCCQW